MPYLNAQDFAEVRAALGAGVGMCDNALPKFDWGKSPLDGDAIQSLNETPGALREALALVDAAQAAVASPELCEQARDLYGSDDIEIDDEGAGTSEADTGVWVQAWVFVRHEEENDGDPDEQ